MDGVLLVGGPTASGKSEAAVRLAQEFGAEIVGADSRQIYRDMPVGTAAPTAEQRDAVPHHLVAFVDPYERYSAARYVIDAMRAIDDVRARGKRVVVVGGTGFYLRALAGAVELDAAYDAAARERLSREARVHPPEVLHAWLAAVDSGRAAAIDPADSYRVLRALEIRFAATPAPNRAGPLPTLHSCGLDFAYVTLDVPLDVLDRRIASRVDAMLARGFVEEAERIGLGAAASSAVGYPSAIAWTRGWSTEPELREHLARETRRYARRQRTWFRGERIARPVAAADLAAVARESLGWR